MAKRFRIRDRVLLAAAVSGDLFFEFVQPYSFQMAKLKGKLPPGYKLTNFTAAVSRMLATGYLQKVIKNGRPYLRMTGIGKRALVRDFPVFGLRGKKWDRKWRIVFYDIPEEKKKIREQFQAKLKELGFGMVKESTYLSPFDVADDLREFISVQGLEKFVFVCVASQLLAGDEKLLADKVWGLEELNRRYEKIAQEIKKGEKMDKVFSEYEEILRQDPCLPYGLLPDDWMGEKVHQAMQKLMGRD